jgi:heat shock protein HslJ
MCKRDCRRLIRSFGLLLAVGCAGPAADPEIPTAGRPYETLGYTIEGDSVQLIDGVAESASAPGSASRVMTRSVGNALHKDLNGDGTDDVVFLLAQERGGSGTFYYVVAALRRDDAYVGSHGLLLGDRIAPQAITSGPGSSIVVTYADHAPGEPMAAPPSIVRSRRLLLNDRTLQFGEVAQDFTGEADPSRMTLGMKTWNLIRAQHADGRAITIRQPARFSLTFQPDGTFAATTDCNRVRGSYTTGRNSIDFGEDMASTKVYCEGSQEGLFTGMLRETSGYHFTSRGELVLELSSASGVVAFR